MSSDNLHRTQTVSDLETGTSEAIRRHAYRHVLAAKSISQRILHFERITPDQLSCIAEATGAFFYVYVPQDACDLFCSNRPDGITASPSGTGSIANISYAAFQVSHPLQLSCSILKKSFVLLHTVASFRFSSHLP